MSPGLPAPSTWVAEHLAHTTNDALPAPNGRKAASKPRRVTVTDKKSPARKKAPAKKAAVKKTRSNTAPERKPGEPLTNAQHERFCQEYLVDYNARRSAEVAGFSVKTARAQGSRLLTRVDIQERLHELSDNLREKTEIDAVWVRKRLAMLATADLRHLLDEQGNIRPPSEWPDDIASAISGMDVQEIGGDLPATIKKIRKVDQLKALELLGKHKDIAAFKEVVEHNAGEGMIEAIMAGRRRARGDD